MSENGLIQAIPVPIVEIAPDGRLSVMNAGAEALFGPGLVGRHFITVFRQPALLDRIDEVQATGTSSRGRYLASLGGRDLTYEVTVAPFIDPRGSRSLILVFEDVTTQEEAGVRRSEFVANVSHELRTPLTALTGFIETLRGPAKDDPEARDRFLDIMEREARRMNRLVDDLLSLSRVEDVERMRPTETVDIAALLRSVAGGLEPQAARRNVTLVLTGCDGDATLPGDPDQLTQVFTNLVENAIKYGRDAGHVEISLTWDDNVTALRGPGAVIRVRDDGEGIDERHLGRLTERFYRVDTHRSRGMGGTGLGLAIVKHIVNRHRGRLRIESTLGEGSLFTVSLPSK